jgi:hypothetical protein
MVTPVYGQLICSHQTCMQMWVDLIQRRFCHLVIPIICTIDLQILY